MTPENDHKTTGGEKENTPPSTPPQREIPIVPPKDRTNLSEGVENPRPSTQQINDNDD